VELLPSSQLSLVAMEEIKSRLVNQVLAVQLHLAEAVVVAEVLLDYRVRLEVTRKVTQQLVLRVQ